MMCKLLHLLDKKHLKLRGHSGPPTDCITIAATTKAGLADTTYLKCLTSQVTLNMNVRPKLNRMGVKAFLSAGFVCL